MGVVLKGEPPLNAAEVRWQRLMTASSAVRKHGSVQPASTEKDSPARYSPERAEIAVVFHQPDRVIVGTCSIQLRAAERIFVRHPALYANVSGIDIGRYGFMQSSA